MLPWLHAVRVHLYDEQDEEVSVGHPQKLLEEVEGEERNDVVLWRRHHVVLQTQKQQPMETDCKQQQQQHYRQVRALLIQSLVLVHVVRSW